MRKFNTLMSVLITVILLISSIEAESFPNLSPGPGFEYKAKGDSIRLDTIYLDEMKDVVELEIEFENKGDAPLIVHKVTGCCGTQITGWTKKPLRPGEKGIINVLFRVPPRPHKISRTVRTYTNAPGGEKKLNITGAIAERDDGSIDL